MPNIRLVTFAGQTVSPIDDALVYQTAIGDSGIIYGATVTLADTNTLHVTAGYGIASGRFFEIYDSDVIVPLASSGTLNGQLYVHMDLASAQEPISLEYETAATLSPMQQDANVNVTNGVYEFQLATFTINTSTISALNYTAPIVAGSGSGMIGEAENSNRASKSYAVGDFMIWGNKLWRVTTAIASGGTITTAKLAATTVVTEIGAIKTNLGGFMFGFTSDNKPGFKAPGADTVIPFSGIEILGTVTEGISNLSENQEVTIAGNVDFSDFRFYGLYLEALRGQHPYGMVSIIFGNVYVAYASMQRTLEGVDPRAEGGTYGIFIPLESTGTGAITLKCNSSEPFRGKSITLYGIR